MSFEEHWVFLLLEYPIALALGSWCQEWGPSAPGEVEKNLCKTQTRVPWRPSQAPLYAVGTGTDPNGPWQVEPVEHFCAVDGLPSHPNTF